VAKPASTATAPTKQAISEQPDVWWAADGSAGAHSQRPARHRRRGRDAGDDTPSRIYHALKWSLPDGVALAVASVGDQPKAQSWVPGTNSWLRARLR